MKKIIPASSLPLTKDPRSYAFIGIIVLLLLHHQFAYFGHYGYDDIMGYAYYAQQWADGKLFFLNDDFFSYRWGFISLTGFFYALFGMSDGVSAITPSLVCLTTVLLIFRVCRSYSPWVGVLAALIYILDNWTLFYTDKLMPDTAVALCAFAAFVIIQEYRYSSTPKHAKKYGITLAVILLIGFLFKQTILLLFPVFFFFFAFDLIQKKHRQFWITTAISCITLGSFYLLLIYGLTGDAMMRFKVAEAGHAANLGRSFAHCNYAGQSWEVLLSRISTGLLQLLFTNGCMLSILLAIGASLAHRWKEILSNHTKEQYWVMVLLLSFLSSNFMTTSYQAYQPMCLDIRHFLYLIPMAAVVAAPALYQFLQKKQLAIYFVSVVWLGVGFSYFLTNSVLIETYLGLSTALTLRLLFPNKVIFKWITLLGVLVSLAWANQINITEAQKNGYTTQRKIVYQFFKNSNTPAIIFTDPIEHNFIRYLLEFDTNSITQVYTYNSIDTIAIPPNIPTYILVNGYTQYMSNTNYESLPSPIRSTLEKRRPPEIEIVFQEASVGLFRIHDPKILKIE